MYVALLIVVICSDFLALLWILLLFLRLCAFRHHRERNELILIVAYLVLNGVYPLGHLFLAWQRMEKQLNSRNHDFYALRYDCLYEPVVIIQNIGSWSISFTNAFTSYCLIYIAKHPVTFFDVFDWHIALYPLGGSVACTTIAVITELWIMERKHFENTRISGLCFRIDVLGEPFYRLTQVIRISIFSSGFIAIVFAYILAKHPVHPSVVNNMRFPLHSKRVVGTIVKFDVIVLGCIAILIFRLINTWNYISKTIFCLTLPFWIADILFSITSTLLYFRTTNIYRLEDNLVITQMDCIKDVIIIFQITGVWSIIWSPLLSVICAVLLLFSPQLFEKHLHIRASILVIILLTWILLSSTGEILLSLYARSGPDVVDLICSRKLVLGKTLHVRIRIFRWILLSITILLSTICLIIVHLNKKKIKNIENALTLIEIFIRIFLKIMMIISLVSALLVCILLSFLFAVMHTFLVFLIICQKKNREKQEFLFIAGMALGDIIYSIGFFLFACRRLEYYPDTLDGYPMVKRSECLETPAPTLLFLGNNLVGNMNLINAIDRFLATFLPIWYYQQTNRYTIRLILISFLIAAVCTLTNLLFLISSNDILETLVSIDCGVLEYLHPIVGIYINYSQFFFVFLSAIVYIAIFFALRKRYKVSRQITLASKQRNAKRLSKSNTTMALIMMNTFIFLFFPQMLIDLRIGSAQEKIIFYFLVLIKTALNFLIFVCRHEELRSFIIGRKFN